jgi:hypothetical protein
LPFLFVYLFYCYLFSVKQVFSDLDFLGWYTTGEAPTDKDLEVHKQFTLYNESSVFLKLNPGARHVGDLPITVYESVIDLVDGEATMLFVELPYTLATEEAERIGVDHVARMSSSDTGESSLGNTLLLFLCPVRPLGHHKMCKPKDSLFLRRRDSIGPAALGRYQAFSSRGTYRVIRCLTLPACVFCCLACP